MSMTITIVDLALHAAAECQGCRSEGRPKVEPASGEHDATFFHQRDVGSQYLECKAAVIWKLIVKLEASAK